MIVTAGKFAGVEYEVTGSDVNGEVLSVTYNNQTAADRIITIAAGDLSWSYAMIRQSSGTVVVDPGIPGDGCTVSLT